MKTLIIVAAAIALASVAALGQGEFYFNTRDPSAGNDIRWFFPDYCEPASGPDLNLQVLAGPDAAHLMSLTPLLPLNGSGDAAGYPNPFAQAFAVPGMAAGTTATVGYQYFQGTSLATATSTTPLMFALSTVTLTDSRHPPTRLPLGLNSSAALSLEHGHCACLASAALS